MGESDGGVLLDIKLNPTDAGKEFDKLSKKAAELELKLARGKQALEPVKQQAAQLKTQLTASKEEMNKLTVIQQAALMRFEAANTKLEEMRASGTATTDQIKQQVETVNGLRYPYEQATRNVERMGKTVAGLEGKYSTADQKARQMTLDVKNTNTVLTATKEKAAQVAKEMGKGSPTLDKMGTDALKLEKRLMGLAKRVLVFSVFTAGLRTVRSWFADVIKTDKEAVAAIAQLKGALLTLAQPLVGVVIPAFTSFIQVLTQVVSTLAAVMSAVFGTTVEESAAAAENLNNEKAALEGVGAAARKAGKDLAGFDEINKIGGDAAGSGSGSKIITPDFSALKEVPEWVKNLTTDLKFTIKDLFFDFDDLTEEDIMAKVVAGLITLTGTILGFAMGGPGGALLGTIAGVALSLLITNLTFDGDGKINSEEIAKLLISALFMLGGGVLGFMAGGPGGAFLGITAGAAVSLGLSSLIFNNDNVLSAEEIAQGLSVVLGALAGGIVGFTVGGPGGALIGAVIGAGITLGFAEAIFNNDGVMSQEEVLTGIASMLFALAGGIVGFFVGGPAGAALGAMISFGAVALFSNMIFDNDGVVSESEISMGLCTVLGALFGGVIGFFAGGPGGALLGATIGAGAVVLLTDLITEQGGDVDKDKFLKGLAAVLGALLGGVIGFTVGGPGGALLGAVIGLGISLAVSSVDTSSADKSIKRATENWTKSHGDISVKSSAASISSHMARSIPSIDSDDIPHFAKGAVIPANREFAAILGDQTHGNNLEGPEDLFRKIVREESGAGAGGMNSAGIISILQQILAAIKEGKVMVVDQTVFAQIVSSSMDSEDFRRGSPMVTLR